MLLQMSNNIQHHIFLQKLRAYSREPLVLYPLQLLFITCKTKSVLRKALRIEISQTQIPRTPKSLSLTQQNTRENKVRSSLVR